MLSFATSQVLRSEMGGIAPLPISGLTMTRSAGILFRSTAGITPATQAFIDAMKQRARTWDKLSARCCESPRALARNRTR
jgi:hypothetical protein